jgi:hypothetical protein
MGSSDTDNTTEQIIKKLLGVGFEMHFLAPSHCIFYTGIPFRLVKGE